jgi:hypothetical protein
MKARNNEDLRRDELVSVSDPDKALAEMHSTLLSFAPALDYALMDKVHADTRRLFEGRFPGYRACNTKYHDLAHTVSVALGTTRLLHGYAVRGQVFEPRDALLCIVGALFHDSGLIQFDVDLEGSGAKYTVGHEERSVQFAETYLSHLGFSDQEIENCGNFIRCTILDLSPSQIPFPSKDIRTLGHIVGSADLLAQMADRYYLEKLLLLFKEFEEARLPGFDSELTLLQKTEAFYQNVAKKRLSDELGGASQYMIYHFRERWGVDRDLYAESISKNITYLRKLSLLCDGAFTCYLANLRRGGITHKILRSLRANKQAQG